MLYQMLSRQRNQLAALPACTYHRYTQQTRHQLINVQHSQRSPNTLKDSSTPNICAICLQLTTVGKTSAV
eukprot:2323672-Ditylum_brightwellii.AAC.1